MKKHMFWFIELFLWLLILFSIAGGIMLFKYSYKKQFNTYQIFTHDVDGLINGSPVKILGIQVGYVSQIDILGDEVYVKFIITEKGVRIPPGSIVTVEFFGLGGSKSLEIYPPESKIRPNGKFLVVQNPKRIHDSLGLLSDMFDKVVDITYTTSNFMKKAGILENGKTKKDFGSVEDFLDNSTKWIDNAQKKADNVSNGFSKKEKNDTTKPLKSEHNQ